MEPLKLAVIGLGAMGGAHARDIPKLAEVEVVAVADMDAQLAQTVGAQSGARPYSRWQTLLHDEKARGLEAVLIATPHPFHPEITREAARCGLHVLCEKPLAVSVKAADAMVEACDAAGVMLGVMFQQRIEPSRALMKRMIDEGAVGAIHRVSIVAPWYRPQAYYQSGSWRGTWNGEGGGILMNQAPHSLDQLAWLAGMPRSVQAIAGTRLHQIEVESTALAICDFGDGKLGWFYASTSEVPSDDLFEVAGDKGVLRNSGGKVSFFELETPLEEHLRSATAMFASPRGAWRDIAVEGRDEGHNAVVRAFAQAVRAQNPALMTAAGEDGVRSLELANAMLMAGYTRREVALPLDRDAYEAMLAQLQSGVAPGELKRPGD